MAAIPDLLHLEPSMNLDQAQLYELLEIAFLGKDTGTRIDRVLATVEERTRGWDPDFFAEDLFVDELLDNCFPVVSDGQRYTKHRPFLARVLASPPTDGEEIRWRQGIVAELETRPEISEATHRLYRELYDLLAMLRLPGHSARLDINSYRLDVLRKVEWAVSFLEEGFADAESGLGRLAETGRTIRSSESYGLLRALLDYEQQLSTLDVSINIGATGRLTELQVRGIQENTHNPFYRAPWRRLWDRFRFLWRGYQLSRFEVVSRLLQQVFQQNRQVVAGLVQLLGHLELYLANQGFRGEAAGRGLEVCLPRLSARAAPLAGEISQQESAAPAENMLLEKLFNPLLLRQPAPPVPCRIENPGGRAVTLITGPNSGGKTRLLQALGLTQLLAQSGLYVPASRACVPVCDGLYVSLIERDAADQEEGRLGRELMRIRTMFEAMGPHSMVIFDELCSGTNPSEAVEVFNMVLRLLEELGPLALISTHFLDYARRLEQEPPIASLRYLQVEVSDEQSSTYQFVPGVAATSLAALMAQRLGVTFEELAVRIRRRRVGGESVSRQEAEEERVEALS